MLIRIRKGWELPEVAATPEGVYLNRRVLLRTAMGALPAATLSTGILGTGSALAQAAADPNAGLYPAKRNGTYTLDRAITDEDQVLTYNNFYEFGTTKNIRQAASKLPLRPWTVRIDGMVHNPGTVDFDTLLKAMPIEERLYRHRCVETWAMAVPWTGFALAKLVEYAQPMGSAKYLVMRTFDNKVYPAPGLRQPWYPWPYTEGLTMAEATNPLAFIATGLYGKPLKPQNGAPLRLAVPWKYGFKSVKSIVSFTFTDTMPTTFWSALGQDEYGFWANVNPAVPHPRWSQASERMLGTGETRPTQIYNGYGEYVAGLYKGLENERLYV